MIQSLPLAVKKFQIHISQISKFVDAAAKYSKAKKILRLAIFVLCNIVPNVGTNRGPIRIIQPTSKSKKQKRRVARMLPKNKRKSGTASWLRARSVKSAIASSSSKRSCRTRICKLRHRQISCSDLKVSTHKWKLPRPNYTK